MDVCKVFVGWLDALCLYDGLIEEEERPSLPNEKKSFKDVWSIVLSLDDDELTLEDLMDIVSTVMPEATQNEIEEEFDLHDINKDDIVSLHEAD